MALFLMKLFFFSIFFLSNFGGMAEEESCFDIDGREVEHGLLYVPGPNVCTQCVCHHSEPKWCQTMFCNGPPYGCKDFIVGKTCCQFQCLDLPTEKSVAELRERLSGAATNIHPAQTVISVVFFISKVVFISHIL